MAGDPRRDVEIEPLSDEALDDAAGGSGGSGGETVCSCEQCSTGLPPDNIPV